MEIQMGMIKMWVIMNQNNNILPWIFTIQQIKSWAASKIMLNDKNLVKLNIRNYLYYFCIGPFFGFALGPWYVRAGPV
jgi:hypothetical protein